MHARRIPTQHCYQNLSTLNEVTTALRHALLPTNRIPLLEIANKTEKKVMQRKQIEPKAKGNQIRQAWNFKAHAPQEEQPSPC